MKIQVSLKPDKNGGYFTRRRMYIPYTILLNHSWNENFQKNFAENIKIQMLFLMPFSPDNRALMR